METALERIAAIASTLKEAELRTLLELARRANNGGEVRCSSRKLAEATRQSRRNVQGALDTLAERGLIATDGGSATRASSYQLTFTRLAVLTGPGAAGAPPPSQQVALFERHPGAAGAPPTGAAGAPPLTKERARASATSNFPSSFENPYDVAASTGGKNGGISRESLKVLDAILRANPKKAEPELLEKAKDRLYGYMRKFGPDREPHPPDQQIIAQFLAIAPWPQLDGVLDEIWRKRQPAGSNYAWFLGVALQRIHGLKFDDVRQRREDLKLVSPAELQRRFDQAPQRKAMR